MTRHILFVCTGNICRSPLAEAVLRHKITLVGRAGEIVVDSAGTQDYHVGERPDPRTIKVATINSVPTEGIRARQVEMSDFERFDLILGMDAGHVRHLKKMSPPEFHHRIHLYLEYTGAGVADVPDPYYGGFEGFEEVYDMINQASDKLI